MGSSTSFGKTSSMTAFGAARYLGSTADYICEIRCVNHRFLDVHMRLPEELKAHESDFKEIIANHMSRGRVDVSVKKNDKEASCTHAEVNQLALDMLFASAEKVLAVNNTIAPLNMSEVLRWPGVMQAPEHDAKQIKQEALISLTNCIDVVKEARQNEGSKLHGLISDRVGEMRDIVTQVKSRMPELQEQYRSRLEEKLEAIKESMEESRLEQEMVLFLNKTDVIEELDRLNIHFDEVINTPVSYTHLTLPTTPYV